MANVMEDLQQLADACGVQTAYHDDRGGRHEATTEALLAVLHALGVPLIAPDEAKPALANVLRERWNRLLEPVSVAWDGLANDIAIRLPASVSSTNVSCTLMLETGTVSTWSVPIAGLPMTGSTDLSGVAFRTHRLAVPGTLPFGYHQLQVEAGKLRGECVVLAAPRRAYQPDQHKKTWGGFLPLYAVRSARDWGAGDLADLEHLIDYVQNLGGGIVGTLPLLAAFLDKPCEPSPYSPASRLFWNEFYLAIERLPELERCPSAQQYLASTAFQTERSALRATTLVDYPRLMALKRRALEQLAATCFREGGERLDALRQHVASHPRLPDYAAFRATVERHQATWWNWTGAAHDGKLVPADYGESAYQYHLYVQWQADMQLRGLSDKASVRGPGLYLDLPLGVNADSYDVWRERDSFALGLSAGAPPDVFFTKGQDWGFPPLHPERCRANGYRYLRAYLKHHMQYAGLLRIDHLMGLHRLYWVPNDLGPLHGVYVRYPADELYAVFSIESHRYRTALVGEDLGTVPDYVRPAMADHNVNRLYVAQYECGPEPDRAFPTPSSQAVASLNTHDMPTFAAFWRGLDIADRESMGLMDEKGAQEETRRRDAIRANLMGRLRELGWLGRDEDTSAVLRACLQHLATTDAQVVLANLEDLWQALEPQNRPGTWKDQPNWRTKAKFSLEQFDAVPNFRTTLIALDRASRRDSF